MKFKSLICAVMLAIGAQMSYAADFAAGKILVGSAYSEQEVQDELSLNGAGKARKLHNTGKVFHVNVPEGKEEEFVEKLKKNKKFEFAELDKKVKVDFAANDPYYTAAYHLHKVNASAAWDIAQGNGVTIAILDTGVQSNHPDLAQNMVAGYNFYDNTPDTTDTYGHGTAVAGTAAAVTNNLIGVASIAPMAKIMPIKVTDPNGSGYWSAMTSGIYYAADRGVRVANISFAGGADSASIQAAATYLRSKNGVVVYSAGNTGTQLIYQYNDNIIYVSATDANDVRTSWSSFGDYVDVAAPGIGIYTTRINSTYATASGTSFSAPLTAGVIASMMAANPKLTIGQIETILFATAVDIGTAGKDIYYGHGRVDAFAAVKAAQETIGTRDDIAPMVTITNPINGSTITKRKGSVAITATAYDNVDATVKIDLYINGGLRSTTNAASLNYSWNLNRLSPGTYTITVTATDSSGNSSSATSTVYR